MNVGTLFSGIGGFELGFSREGFKTKWFIENNEYCQAVLRKNFPNIPIYEDIREIDFRKLERVNILTGGFPCQDISCANPRGKGIKGERSGLWTYYAKAIREIRPEYAVIENVPMLANRGLNIILRDLAENGYDAEWFCLRASNFGALHRRERLFIIAYPMQMGREGYRQETRFITHDWNERIQRFCEESLQREQGFSWCQDVRRIEDLQERPDIPQPLFRGGRDGIPNWMDRIKCCGNAVVPQAAQFIARRIKEIGNPPFMPGGRSNAPKGWRIPNIKKYI